MTTLSELSTRLINKGVKLKSYNEETKEAVFIGMGNRYIARVTVEDGGDVDALFTAVEMGILKREVEEDDR